MLHRFRLGNPIPSGCDWVVSRVTTRKGRVGTSHRRIGGVLTEDVQNNKGKFYVQLGGGEIGGHFTEEEKNLFCLCYAVMFVFCDFAKKVKH